MNSAHHTRCKCDFSMFAGWEVPFTRFQWDLLIFDSDLLAYSACLVCHSVLPRFEPDILCQFWLRPSTVIRDLRATRRWRISRQQLTKHINDLSWSDNHQIHYFNWVKTHMRATFLSCYKPLTFLWKSLCENYHKISRTSKLRESQRRIGKVWVKIEKVSGKSWRGRLNQNWGLISEHRKELVCCRAIF